MRTKLVAGNWKMNLTKVEACATIETFVKMVDAKSNVDVVICPPYLNLGNVRDLLRDTHIKVGAQDVFWLPNGAFTGKVSAPMLRDAGVAYCIVGHSETRGRFGKIEVSASALSYFGETDETVNLKLKALLYESINPILCVGETQDERDAGKTEAVIEAQLKGALDSLDPSELYAAVVAYEPVWAIGTGKTCYSAEAGRVCGFIRSTIGQILDDEVSQEMRVLYGGSVKAANAGDLFSQSDIDGALVGGSSLDPHEFSRIVMSA